MQAGSSEIRRHGADAKPAPNDKASEGVRVWTMSAAPGATGSSRMLPALGAESSERARARCGLAPYSATVDARPRFYHSPRIC